MLHARKDYNKRVQDKANKIPMDEPVFLLRAQDKHAVETVEFWADKVRTDGDGELADRILVHAERMREWKKKKSPDCNSNLFI